MTVAKFFPDEFEKDAEFGRRNHGANNPHQSGAGWPDLIAGKTIGKRVVLPIVGGRDATNSEVDMLDVRGDDRSAIPLSLVLTIPRVIIQPKGDYVQNMTGEQDNEQVLVAPAVAGTVIRWPNLYAVVQWGIGGVQNQAVIDFVNGLVVNLTTCFVRVSVKTASVLSIIPSGAPVVLAAHVGPGTPKPNNAQYTQFIGRDLVVGVETAPFAVPRFAKSVRLVGSGAFSGTIRFWRSSDGPGSPAQYEVCSYTFTSTTTNNFNLPNGAYYYTVTNTGIAPPNTLSAVFELAI